MIAKPCNPRMKVTTLVRRIGKEYGFTRIRADAVGYILWEHTGWPAFFQGPTEIILPRQLRAFFRKARRRRNT